MSKASWAWKGVWGREAWDESCPRQVGLGKVSGAGRPGMKSCPRQVGLGEVSGAGRPRMKAVLGR